MPLRAYNGATDMALGIGISGGSKSGGGGGSSDTNFRLVDNANTDFDIADTEGNIVARFNDGHVTTKNFSSATLAEQQQNIEQSIADLASDVAQLRESVNALRQELSGTASALQNSIDDIYNNAVFASASDLGDLVIADRQHNILVRFRDGHIETKNFKSAELMNQLQTLTPDGQTDAD